MGIILSNGFVRAYPFHASHEGFYIADGTIAINLIVLSCFFFVMMIVIKVEIKP